MLVTVNEALRDLLQAAKPKVSLDALDREARDKGISIARNTIARARRGELGPRPKEETVQALADLFGVDPRKIREAVGRPPGELGPFEPDPRSASLTQAQRDALNQLIVAIVSQEGGQLDGQQPEAQKTPHSTPADEQTPTQQGVSTTGGGVTSPPTDQDELARRREADRLAKIEADWLEKNPGMGTKAARTDNDEDKGQ